MNCPYCGTENIDGVDDCRECGQPLSETHLLDPATAIERSVLTDRVAALGPKEPVAVSADTSVRVVLRTMVDRHIGCVVVAEAGRPVGIFSERDAIVKLSTRAVALGDRPVSDFMTGQPETVALDAKVAFAVHRMDVGGYRHVPIVGESGELVGIISVRDILRYLTDKLAAG